MELPVLEYGETLVWIARRGISSTQATDHQ
ncbi:hypothetical protein ACWG8W_00125 [Citricoccus zhacaiensis]